MGETETPKLGTVPSPGARVASLVRVLVYAGAAGTLVLALNGVAPVLTRLSERGAMSEVVVIVPLWALVGVWMLAPYWGALRLHRYGSATTGESVLAGCAALALIALGANSFLATSAFVGGKPHPTADGVTIVFMPIVQWAVLGVAGVLLRVSRVIRRRGQTG
jgi:hypothetical protein